MKDHWETAEDLTAAFERAGAQVSTDQLRRWRDQGLMPAVRQIGLGRGQGSVVRYPPGTANLAIEISRLLAIKKKVSFVGWQLWMHGYEIADQFWKPAIYEAATDLKHIRGWLRLVEKRYADRDTTIFDEISISEFAGSPVAKGLSRLSLELQALAYGLIADVAKGEFTQSGFTADGQQGLNIKSLLGATGLSAAASKAIAALLSLRGFGEELEVQLAAISDGMAEIHSMTLSEICQIAAPQRTGFANLLAFANQIDANIPQFRKSAIGRFAKAISADRKLQAVSLIIWSRFSLKGSIRSLDAISELRDNLNLDSAD